MRKETIKPITIILVLLLLILSIIPWPKSIDSEIEGIRYQLGHENMDYSEKVSIKFDGTYYRSVLGVFKRSFKGYIYINGLIINSDEAFYLKFDRWDRSDLRQTYYYYDENRVKSEHFGTLYADGNFQAITINIMIGTYERKNWNSGDGFMISAPAANREEALELSRDLMNPIGYELN